MGAEAMAAPAMTKESVRAIIDGVENDPLAGLGCFSKKDILIDRILAHARTTQPAQLGASPRAILTDPSLANGSAAEN
jgi:hypothetical protein